jgi:hypothetical protein
VLMTGYGKPATKRACCFQGAGISTIAVFTKNRSNPAYVEARLGAGRKGTGVFLRPNSRFRPVAKSAG